MMTRDSETLDAIRGHRALVFDFGTTSLKVAVVENEEILGETNISYHVAMQQDGWAEQDPDELWQLAGQASRSLLERFPLDRGSINSIVFIAPWKAIIPVSATGQVLRPAMIWLDARATAEASTLNERVGEFVGTGQEIWPRLMWCRSHEPRTWDDARWIMGLVTYFKWRATGEVATEPSDDFITSPDHDEQRRFSGIVEAAGLGQDLHKFPRSRPASQSVGTLQAESAAHLGLLGEPDVIGGFGDLPAITLGAGPVKEGAAHLYIGTSSWFAVIDSAAAELKPPLTFRLDAQHTVALYPLQTAGMAFDWIVRELYGYEQPHLHEDLLQRVNRDVASVPAGSDRLLATHWLNGELPPLDKNVRGAFINLTPRHQRQHMVRAMMESLCYTHRGSIETYEAATGQAIPEVVCTGGGATSPVWMQMLADVLGRTVIVPPNPRYTGVVGGYRLSVGPNPTTATARPPQRYEPEPADARVYDEMFNHFQGIYPALRDLFTKLNGS